MNIRIDLRGVEDVCVCVFRSVRRSAITPSAPGAAADDHTHELETIPQASGLNLSGELLKWQKNCSLSFSNMDGDAKCLLTVLF